MRSSLGEGGSTSILLLTSLTPSMSFTTFSAESLRMGFLTCPVRMTVSPSTLKARLSKMLSWGSVTNSFRTSWEMRSCECWVAVDWAAQDVKLAASITVKLDATTLFIGYPYNKNSGRNLGVALEQKRRLR